MIISIFGGSECNREYYDKVYNFALNKLSDPNITIINGSCMGTMEAVAKAAKINKVKVIGTNIHKWDDCINKYNSELIYFDNELLRLNYILDKSDIFIILDGNIGTLEEFFISWLYCTDHNKKIIITSKKQNDLVNYLINNNFIKEEYRKCISYIELEDLDIGRLL